MRGRYGGAEVVATARPDDAKPRLPVYRKLAFGSANVMQSLLLCLWYSYGVAFFTYVLEIPPASVGTIILVSQIGGALFNPIIGTWSDHIPFRKWRRKSFHLLGMVTGTTAIFLWNDCLGCSNAPINYRVLYIAVFAALFEFSWACNLIALYSLIPELTTDKDEQVALYSYRYFFFVASYLTVFIMMWILLEKLDHEGAANLTPTDKDVFWIIAAFAIGVGILISSPFHFLIHEDPSAHPLKLKWYKWFGNSRFWLVLCLFTVTRGIDFFPNIYLPLYLLNTLHMDKASIAKAPLLLYGASIIATVFIQRFNKFIGYKMTYFIGAVFVWVAMMWFWLKEQTGDQLSRFDFARDNIYGATILMGIGIVMCWIVAAFLVAELVGQYKGSGAFVCGWMFLANRTIIGVLVKIVQEFHPDTPVTEADSLAIATFYRGVMVYTTLCLSVIGVLIIALMTLQEMCVRRRHGRQEPFKSSPVRGTCNGQSVESRQA